MSETPIERTTAEGGQLVGFEGFAFDVDADLLSRDGERVHLPPQPAKVLGALVRSRGRLVTRDELRDTIWGNDRFAEFDQGLNFCIRQIRLALGDNADAPRFIETLPRRGYRFIPPIATLPSRRSRAPRRRELGALVTGVALAIVAVLWSTASTPSPTLDQPEGSDEVLAKQLPTADRVRFLRAVQLMNSQQAGAYAAARSILDSVVATQPAFAPAQVRRSEAQLWSGDVDGARSTLDQQLAVVRNDGRLYTLRGALALFRDWDVTLALQHFTRGVALAPASSMAHHYLAYAHLITGDTASARRDITRALALDPLSPTLNGDAGMIYYWLRDYRSARESCERGASAVPQSRATAYCLLLVSAVSGDRAALAHSAAVLARIDSAPTALVERLNTGSDQSVALNTYLRWGIDRLATRASARRGNALAIARFYILLGEPDSASLAIASSWGRERSNDLLYALVDPLLDGLSDRTTIDAIAAALGRATS